MPAFSVRLLNAGKLIERIIEGVDAADVRVQLGRGSGIVVAVQKKRGISLRSRAPKFALALFLQELSTLLDAGLVLIEALEALRDRADAGKSATSVIARILAVMYEGQPLSKALAKQPEIFPELLVATIESAEGSGQLPCVLKRYQQYETRIVQIKKRVVGALVYPAVVISVGLGILLFMAFFVIPRFAAVFETLNTLPATAQLMLWWANLLKENGMLVGILMAAVIAGAVLLLRTQTAKNMLRRGMWRTPRIRDVCALFALTRFYRTVGLLITGGTPVIWALELSGKILPEHYRLSLAMALTDLRAGQPVAAVLASRGLTTSVAERLLRVGEQSGNLGGMCEHIAHFHDTALDRSIETFSQIFEPILMLAVGATVGAVVILLYMPIFELAGSIG